MNFSICPPFLATGSTDARAAPPISIAILGPPTLITRLLKPSPASPPPPHHPPPLPPPPHTPPHPPPQTPPTPPPPPPNSRPTHKKQTHHHKLATHKNNQRNVHNYPIKEKQPRQYQSHTRRSWTLDIQQVR